MQIDSQAVPITQAPQKILTTLQNKLKEELERMEQEQVIVKVEEPTDWVHSAVIVKKPNGKFRV